MNPRNYLTTAQAAELIGCTIQHVRVLLRLGRLRGWKFDERTWLVDRRSAAKYRDFEPGIGRKRISEIR